MTARNPNDDLDVLLTVAAADGLTSDEQARVDALLAGEPEAAAELAARRKLLAELKRSRPAPAREPSWDAMASTIAEAARPSRPDAAPARPWLRPAWRKPAALAGGFALAAAAAGLLWIAQRSGGPGRAGSQGAARPHDGAAPVTIAPEAELDGPELVGDLDDGDLDDVLATLGAGLPSWIDLDPYAAPDLRDPPGPDDIAGGIDDAEPWTPPDAESWPQALLDEISPEALDAVDRSLAEPPVAESKTG